MQRPNDESVSSKDIKLLPEHWGRRYGLEIKKRLVDYLFTNTKCQAVEATPNVNNLASIKMQESAGGVRVGEGMHEFPESTVENTAAVHYYIYRIYRKVWEERRQS